MIICAFVNAQQTPKFRFIKEKHEHMEQDIRQKCAEDIAKVTSVQAKHEMQINCNKEIKQLKDNRNQEYLAELMRIKNEGNNNVNAPGYVVSTIGEGDAKPEFPGGSAAFQKEIADNFDFTAVKENGEQKCIVVLTIEKDGSIRNVRAEGGNENFNQQAEIAVYLIQNKWNPAISGGKPVAYEIKVPLTMTLPQIQP